MVNEILKPETKVNGHKIKNESYRDWMNSNSDISKAIYHLEKAANYLLVWTNIEENTNIASKYSKNIECFCNQVAYIQSEITNFVDNNLEILELENIEYNPEK